MKIIEQTVIKCTVRTALRIFAFHCQHCIANEKKCDSLSHRKKIIVFDIVLSHDIEKIK